MTGLSGAVLVQWNDDHATSPGAEAGRCRISSWAPDEMWSLMIPRKGHWPKFLTRFIRWRFETWQKNRPDKQQMCRGKKLRQFAA